MRQGFSLNSAHYLIKPVKDEDFAQAMANCRLGTGPPGTHPCRHGGGADAGGGHPPESGIWRYSSAAWCCTPPRGDLPLGRSFSAAAAAPLERDRRFLLCFKGVLVNMDHIAAQTGDELRLDDGEHPAHRPPAQAGDSWPNTGPICLEE